MSIEKDFSDSIIFPALHTYWTCFTVGTVVPRSSLNAHRHVVRSKWLCSSVTAVNIVSALSALNLRALFASHQINTYCLYDIDHIF